MRYHLVTHMAAALTPFKAIADDTRRRILDLLRDGALTTGAIAGNFRRHSRPAISKHLALLRRARLVRMERRGRERVYHLNAAPLRAVDAWLDRYAAFWDENLLAFKRYVEALPPEEGDAHDPEG